VRVWGGEIKILLPPWREMATGEFRDEREGSVQEIFEGTTEKGGDIEKKESEILQ